MHGFWRMKANTFIAITPRFNLIGEVPADWVQSMGQIELNYVFILKWSVGKRIVFDF